ncbi:RAI1-domain-containing protein [Tilletiaria anomala UBC 951]|uniref:Decapping nuclease n=1 Tax=Tilletiaria anomala (strain ATCC 24038 / CBS 436.72 / UBC 951) TaxID=1037660 RepID=A0A066VHD6_TILAU|nr:RAI1-domain-containing protein [Tilletiaria anomala UBC 951]KDN41152.1 RAI1-domain-containing protein [Tilletiaria anomala UBC 951]
MRLRAVHLAWHRVQGSIKACELSSSRVFAMDSSNFRLSNSSAWAARPKPAEFQLPSRVCSFSLDSERALHLDDRQKKFYRPPADALRRGPLDLNHGFDQYISRNNMGPERLDALLTSLQHEASNDAAVDAQLRRAAIITWRGIVTKLCTALYADRDGFELNAQMVGDTIFLEEHVSAVRQTDIERQGSDARSKLFSYYGYSFESYFSSGPSPDSNCSVWSGDVNTNEQWCQVVKTKLGRARLLIGGEVDCVGSKGEMVELKTSMLIRNARDEERFETKMLRFYMQSFLLGVSTVVVGFRDHKGMLQAYQEFKTLEIPRLVRGKPHAWDPKACLNFAAALLDHIERLMRTSKTNQTAASPNVWRITWQPGQPEVAMRQLSEKQIAEDITKGEQARFGILPREFVNFLQSSQASHVTPWTQ